MKKLFLAMLLFLCSCSPKIKTPIVEDEAVEDDIVEVSFSAVGDNLIHNSIYLGNEDGNGGYNFDSVYSKTKFLTNDADISYINLETLCAGASLGLSNYPAFNGPTQVLDALVNAGFNWLSAASNHSFDRGEEGVIAQLEYMKKYPEVTISGMSDNATSGNVQVIEKNGLKVGVASYTYGLNGYVLPEDKEYLVSLTDKEVIASDIEKMKVISDIQVVSMHWGSEYQFKQNEEQEELAQFLSDLGVDVIIGAHPHVIQPVTYLTGKEGNETLVIYSLGNFVSAQHDAYNMLGLMGRWKISYNKATDEWQFKDVEFWPTITAITDNFETYHTYVLKDYTDELAKEHSLTLFKNQDVSRQYFIDLVDSVVGDEVNVIY